MEFVIFTKRRHVCSTPGCREHDTYRIARTAGGNNVLFLCEKCIKEAYKANNQAKKEKKEKN